MPTEPPATLAGWLRTRSDEQLSALLAARPDVARPAPSDLVALASRLAVPVSVDRALDELDAATLQVLDVVLLAPTDGVAPDELIAALTDLPDVLIEALERLTTRALLWGDDVLHAPDPVRRAGRSRSARWHFVDVVWIGLFATIAPSGTFCARRDAVAVDV